MNNKSSFPTPIIILAALFVMGVVGTAMLNAHNFSSPEYRATTDQVAASVNLSAQDKCDTECIAILTVETTGQIAVHRVTAYDMNGNSDGFSCDQIPPIARQGTYYSCYSNNTHPASKICIDMGNVTSIIICKNIDY